MNVAEALAGVSTLFLDTAPVIYLLENNPEFGGVVSSLFRAAERHKVRFVTSPVTLAETLIHPLRQNLTDLTEKYRRLICAGENSTFWPIGEREASRAAALRAAHNLTLTDSLQAAVCLEAGCDAFLTNDPHFERLPDFQVVLIHKVSQ